MDPNTLYIRFMGIPRRQVPFFFYQSFILMKPNMPYPISEQKEYIGL